MKKTWMMWMYIITTGLCSVFACALYAEIELKGCGANYENQLALGDVIYTNRLTRIPGISGLLTAKGGADYSVALLENHTVMAWGNNTYGQLGVGDFQDRDVPALITNLTGVQDIHCGQLHVMALMTNGTVKAWGHNNNGQLGQGSFGTNSAVPLDVPGLSNVIAIACGYNHTLALVSNGNVYAWGSGTSGQLGLGHSYNTNAPALIPALSNVIAVGGGYAHSLFVLDDGTGMSCGLNNDGQLGHNNARSTNSPAAIIGLTNAVAVDGGYAHSVALLSNQTMMAWGANSDGELGTGDRVKRYVATAVSNLSGVLSFAAGHWHTLARLNDDSVNAWGRNSHGQLGTGGADDQTTPTAMLAAGPTRSVGCGIWHSLIVRTVAVDFVIADIELEHDMIVWGDEKPETRSDHGDRVDRETRARTGPPVSHADNRLYKDTVFTATVTVSNRGCNAADAGTLAVWANMASQAVCDASGDFSQAIGSLAGGTGTQVVFSALNVGTTACTRTFRAFIDSTCSTEEDYEDNNQSVATYRVIDPAAQYFTAQAFTNRIVLLWNAPFYTGVSNNTVMVRWSDAGYPTDTSDGSLLYSGTNTTCIHSGVSEYQMYYYRLWVSQNGVDWMDPVSGTNQASTYPHLVPVQVLLRCSETYTSGAKTKTDCRALLFDGHYTGTVKTNDLPDVFSLATKWDFDACGNFNPDSAGDEVLIRDANGTLYLLYFDYAGNLYWNSNDTNDLCWTSYTAGSTYATNASDWSVDGVGDVNGDGMDEIILRGTTTFEEGGKTKSHVRALFFDDNGTGTLEDTQPEAFKLATRWHIEGVGRFNTTAVNSSSDAEQILLQHETDGGFYLLYLNDDGTLYWNSSDTNDICWTSWTPAASYSTNTANWRVDAIGDVNGDQQDEIIVSSPDTFQQGGKTKSNRRVLFFGDNGTGQLKEQQPASFAFANLWTIEGMGNFNPTNVNSSRQSEQLLLRQTNNATFYLLYFDDNGALAWDAADTNTIYWTSYTLGSAYATNATSWSVQGIGDLIGSRD